VIVGTVNKSMAAIASRWFLRKVSQRLAGSGSLGARFIQREMVLSESSKPSIRSSPCSPGWVVSDHPKDQLPNLLRCRFSSNLRLNSGDQPPVDTKTSPVPADDSFRGNDEKGLLTRPAERLPRRAYRRGPGTGEDVGVSARRVVAGARDSPKQDSRGYGRGELGLRSKGEGG
jgi:hypothetical protein